MKHFWNFICFGAGITSLASLLLMWVTNYMPNTFLISIWGLYFSMSGFILFAESIPEKDVK